MPQEESTPMHFDIRPGPKYLLPPTVGFNNHDPTIKRSPAFSLGARFPVTTERKPFTPSPIVYQCCGLSRTGPIKVKGGVLGVKPEKSVRYQGPSPVTYNPDYRKQATIKSSPAVIMASRPKQLTRQQFTPGSNTYKIPHSIGNPVAHMKTAPAYSILGRRHGKHVSSSLSPNPLSYPAVKCDVFKNKPPEWSILGRSSLQRKGRTGSLSPASNAYFPSLNYKSNPPTSVFGVKGKAPIPKSLMDIGYDDIKVEPDELYP